MSLFKKRKEIYPHKVNSQLMHWREGDEIFARNIKAKSWFSKMIAFERNSLNIIYIFRGLTKNGSVILEEKETGHLEKTELRKFLKYAKNKSLKNRLLKNDLDESKEYMELLETFQKAFDELQEADDHPKRLGEPNRKITEDQSD